MNAKTVIAAVAAADHHSYAGLAASEEARLISVDHTGHNIQLVRPDVVLDAVQELLQ